MGVDAQVGRLAADLSGFNFGITLFGTISFTLWMVGRNGLMVFTFLG